VVKENDQIALLQWPSEYELKPDKVSLTEASGKRYLEELLSYVRRMIERKRTISSTSSESTSSLGSNPKDPRVTSTPLRQAELGGTGITRDIEYEREKRELYVMNPVMVNIILYLNRTMFQEEDDGEDTVLQFKTPPSGQTQMALEHLNREIQNLKRVVTQTGARVNTEIEGLKQKVNQNEEKIDQTTERVDSLEVAVEEGNTKNVATLADLSERQDFNSNQAKGNCVLITGEK
jgi:hypothetical protein